MRGTIAKRIRRTVNKRYAFLSDEPMYMRQPNGVLRLAQQCKRALYQKTKDVYKRRHNEQRV